MQSVTKTKLTQQQIVLLAKQAFGQDIVVKNICELTDGYFNTAYQVNLQDGLSTVLKVSPQRDVRVMRYEADLMAVEVSVLKQVCAINGVPVPEVLYHSQGSSLIENDFFFMAFVPGTPLDKLQQNLTKSQAAIIASDLGMIAKKINQIKGDYFGYIARPDMQFGNWREAFLAMIQDLLNDAADAEVMLPFAYEEISDMCERHRDVLNVVELPSLLHKDLWAGNIFVDRDTAQITGLVDFERAIYGDVLMEPVCGLLLKNKAFMEAYWGRSELTQGEQIRVEMYKVYLFLIMVIECSYRKYQNHDIEKWSRMQLKESFLALANLEQSPGNKGR